MELAILQRTERVVVRDTIIMGFYVFFNGKSLETEIISGFLTIIWKKSWKNLIHSSTQLEEWFHQRTAELHRRSNPYGIFIYENFIQNIPYLLLLPYMEIMKSHTIFSVFHSKVMLNADWLISDWLISKLVEAIELFLSKNLGQFKSPV